MTSDSNLWTVDEAAEYLRVSQVTIRRMIRRGEIAAVRAGRLWRVDASSIRPRLMLQPDSSSPEPHTAAYYRRIAMTGRERQHDAPDGRRSS